MIKVLLTSLCFAGLILPTMLEREIDDPMAAAMLRSDRLESDIARDADRKPNQVLDFFGIKRGMHVADLMAGDGYFTEILARSLGKDGKVYCQNTAIPLKVFAEKPLTTRLSRPGLEGVVRLDTEFEDSGLPEGLDAAILVRFYHDFGWQEVDRDMFNDMVFSKLKPGGIFGVVDHIAKAGEGISQGKTLHRVDPALVREEIEAAGFVLEAESFLLRNTKDDHTWNIFSGGGGRRDKTDRFIYLFRKPLE
ncbi:MAG: putative methyltransferase [Candidatus Paceibacteria bacterium]|jgi:predicted methyltransferase